MRREPVSPSAMTRWSVATTSTTPRILSPLSRTTSTGLWLCSCSARRARNVHAGGFPDLPPCWRGSTRSVALASRTSATRSGCLDGQVVATYVADGIAEGDSPSLNRDPVSPVHGLPGGIGQIEVPAASQLRQGLVFGCLGPDLATHPVTQLSGQLIELTHGFRVPGHSAQPQRRFVVIPGWE